MGIKHTVERNFSRHARRYDAHDATQKAIGANLVERLGSRPFESILDLGCGTGNYTRLLHEKYPAARVKAVDLSPAMVEEARHKLAAQGTEFIVADAETATFDAPCNLITSNACFHWFANLDTTLDKCADALTEEGLLAFSALGPRTFWELGECLDTVLPTHQPLSARSFVDKPALEAVLRRHFAWVSVDVETVVEKYPSLLQLLNTIKYTGTRGSGLEGVAMTKTLLHALEEAYRRRVGSVTATYEVFYCLARKKEVRHR